MFKKKGNAFLNNLMNFIENRIMRILILMCA